MKKVNAVTTWIVTICLILHLLIMSYSMLTGWYNFVLCKTLAYATAISISCHILFTLIIFFFIFLIYQITFVRFSKSNLSYPVSCYVKFQHHVLGIFPF